MPLKDFEQLVANELPKLNEAAEGERPARDRAATGESGGERC